MKYALQAAIFDLDGVVTKTANLHSKAWGMTFEKYNSRRKQEGKRGFEPYDPRVDYPKYIDGIPRFDGVRNFLKSRDLELPEGTPGDNENDETVYGLGNQKNELYQELIKKEGVTVLERNVEVIKAWKEKGIRTAVISSSKNCKMILEKAGLEDLFEVRVDGVVSEEMNIPGKPAPDIFLKAAEELGVKPGETLIVEDAQAGVEAGKKGNFRLVIGIINASGEQELLKAGADIAVNDLQELDLEFKNPKKTNSLPSALKCFGELSDIFKKEQPMLFLDFDGTLSPIVEHHKDARISEEMRELVFELSKKYKVAVVSGRGLADVREKVALPEIYYAGSHGYEISGPNGFSKDHEEAVKVMPVFDEIEPILKDRLRDISGVDFERKKFTLAIHYRQVTAEQEPKVHKIVSEVLKDHPKVLPAGGKKVIEIRPDIDWHKGKAVEFLKQQLSNDKDPLSVYVGDDVTDEDAFKFVSHGIGILVGEHGQDTYADYHLENIHQVEQFLRKMLE